jgi:CheY-like chemotaxis protein
MPHLDGYGVLRELQTHQAMLNIPFVFMTAKAMLDDIHQGFSSGALDYLTKPFYRKDLLAVIEKSLKKRDAESSNH